MTEEYSQGRQAIVTKYLGPTKSRGSRVKATASAGSITLAWNDAALAIPWPVAGAPILSAKDARGSALRDAEVFE